MRELRHRLTLLNISKLTNLALSSPEAITGQISSSHTDEVVRVMHIFEERVSLNGRSVAVVFKLGSILQALNEFKVIWMLLI